MITGATLDKMNFLCLGIDRVSFRIIGIIMMKVGNIYPVRYLCSYFFMHEVCMFIQIMKVMLDIYGMNDWVDFFVCFIKNIHIMFSNHSAWLLR